jgi:hypothetical protein
VKTILTYIKIPVLLSAQAIPKLLIIFASRARRIKFGMDLAASADVLAGKYGMQRPKLATAQPIQTGMDLLAFSVLLVKCGYQLH